MAKFEIKDDFYLDNRTIKIISGGTLFPYSARILAGPP